MSWDLEFILDPMRAPILSGARDPNTLKREATKVGPYSTGMNEDSNSGTTGSPI